MFKEFTDKIAVNCRTEAEAKDCAKLLLDNGHDHWATQNPLDALSKITSKYGTGQFCYSNNCYCHKYYYEKSGMKILTYPEFLKLIGKDKPLIVKQDKYEKGDRVKITKINTLKKCKTCYVPEMDEYAERIMVVSSVGTWVGVNSYLMKGDERGLYFHQPVIEGKVIDNPKSKPEPAKQDEPFLKAYIHGNKTVVILSDGRKGKAWCSPEDKQNELTGLTLALKRALGVEVQPKQGEGKPKPES
ncbi:MAG: hypothetical protein EOM59_18965, partial [Clostridia bacterium]|nr:hypothetical protein [Clostridia bacterium]